MDKFKNNDIDIFADLYEQSPQNKSILKNKKRNHTLKDNYKFILQIILIFFIALFIKNFIFSISVVKQSSMSDTLLDGDILIISRINPTNVDKGDIVIVKNPDENSNHKYFVKRVIAFEDDYVEIWKNILLVNDIILEEDYVTYNKNKSDKYSSFNISVPKNHIFVLGDNRDFSNDSRNFGTIPKENIIGKVYIRMYPFERFGFID